jgi:hypothetical protein
MNRLGMSKGRKSNDKKTERLGAWDRRQLRGSVKSGLTFKKIQDDI